MSNPSPNLSSKIPPMDPAVRMLEHNENPYLKRVDALIRNWIQEEWVAVAAIRAGASETGQVVLRRESLDEVKLTPENLASRLDNISISKLRRELAKLGAAPPGTLIRNARVAFGAHLLLYTRLLVKEVAERAGYLNEKHFSDLFSAATGMSPTEYRRAHINEHRAADK